ncbi:hypothetical protein RHGRI_001711 [Rhododendron griersonianum]|nr:hypothetical protein RHGRI_001711 [Rhododendron griersonianum]
MEGKLIFKRRMTMKSHINKLIFKLVCFCQEQWKASYTKLKTHTFSPHYKTMKTYLESED